MAELVDALDLGSSGATRGGSTPSTRTKHKKRENLTVFPFFVLWKGLEPSRPKRALDPEPSASTNSATRAYGS